MLFERERRVAPVLPRPESTGRKHRDRVDASRPMLLPSMDPMVPEPEVIDAATALDDFLALPPAARRDIQATSWERSL